MQNTSQNYYDILGVSKTANLEIIREKYRSLAKKYHPDTCKAADKEIAEENFKLINEAYEVLSDEARRKDYDKTFSRDNIITPSNTYTSNDYHSSNNDYSYSFSSRQSYGDYSYGDDLYDSNHQYNNRDNAGYQISSKLNLKKLSLIFGAIATLITIVVIIIIGVKIDDFMKKRQMNAVVKKDIVKPNTHNTNIKIPSQIIIGLSKEQVKKVLGNPKESSKEYFKYGKSVIFFDTRNKVMGWNKQDSKIKVYLGKKLKGAQRIKVGSTKKDVINAMGTPTYLYLSVWKYNSSVIWFDKFGKVESWSNNSKNLKLK